ncbi:MAG: FAD-binding protein [Hyphomicrobiaceae bacterium]|nr:FAD-binding protein [Hyphomicrobiaceae bacterium]
MVSAKFLPFDPDTLKKKDRITKKLTEILGVDSVITDYDGRRAYEMDALVTHSQTPLAVVLPSTIQQVCILMRFCSKERLKVFPRGAGTSLCGGALPTEDGIVVCISRMNKVLEIDCPNRFMRVEAGITNYAISEAVAAEGYFFAPDPSSQLACTIAGNIATNSSGVRCLKYGTTLNNVLGLKIVTIEGKILNIGGAYHDPIGS